MSGPYRFNQESAKSPLDRTTSPFSAGQPVSFKTNVNRAKTKKWVTAKKNAYDGDDWGDYDEYDEYGVDQEPPAPEPVPSQRYYAGGHLQRTNTDRSFTDPTQQGPPGKARRNSFEAGEEHRAFSASIPPPQHGYGQQQYGEAQRQASGADSDRGREPQGRRDFTPSAMPPPLQTQVSPMPSDVHSSPSRTQFPPRKSSISQTESPMATSPRSRTGSHSDKPLPFVRPSDIYKRVEEERERERASLDSSRPSLDSLSSRPKDELHSPTSDGGRMLPPLETVAERKSEYLPNFDSALLQDDKQREPNGPQSQAPVNHAPVVSPPNDQGFRSVVDQAFTRTDDQRSIPPTPISKDSDSNMSRTNTGSTVGISPIMSRVPSAATSAMKRNQAGGEGSTPVIAEEPSDSVASVPQPTPVFVHDTRAAAPRPVVDHTRNISTSSLPRSGLATPTHGDSPARSPAIAPQQDLPEPTAAQITEDSPVQPHAMEGGLAGPSSAYAAREADLATAAKSSLENATPGLGAAEIQSQDAFLESHAGQSSIDDAVPRSRSESPSKGRVQALAGKFGDVANSRRGSVQSNISRNSVQSWEKSQDNSRAASPTKGNHSKPSSPVKEFRPHLPGQWESYATTAATPLDQSERDRSLDFEQNKATNSLASADLTPTTAKHPVDKIESDTGPDPLAALKSAGAAMAESFKASVGIDNTSSKAQSQQDQNPKGLSHGDMYMPRPLQLERTVSSISSIPPTPPAKDTPVNEQPPQLPPKDVGETTPVQQKRPDFFPQLSTQPSADDQESDRLRKEIVASLTPGTSVDPYGTSLQPASPGTNRASSILPAEYDSYWADGGDHAATRQSQDAERSIPIVSSTANIPAVPHGDESSKPSLLNRFSWENNTPQLVASGSVPKSTTVPEPTKASQEDSMPSPAIQRAAEEERKQWSEGLPEPYFGPDHTFTVTKPDPISDPELSARSPISSIDHGSLASPTREQTRSPGLHVVNSAIDPEAVDLPPRLSADVAAQERSNDDNVKPAQQGVNQEPVNPAISTSVTVPELPSTSQTHAQTQEPLATSPTSPTSGKPLGAREIATINSAAERIATYNQTREHWATHDHGLEGWLTSAIDANPDLATQTAHIQRTSTGTVRHKHTASLSLLGKLGGSSTYQLPGPEQNSSTAAQAPVGGNSPISGAPSSSATAFDRRVASRQLEAKGKDLLHTANVLSGKGLTSAKGLFAKGKSRFGREKGPASRTDSMPSSREASEEPEFMAPTSRTATSTTTTPEKPMAHFSTDTDSPREERKKRRFSITSFRQSSRSRSRPNSIVLPSSTSFFASTPKDTPPRELSRILGEEKSRPHSYHAPDSWNMAPGLRTVSGGHLQSTPPRETSQTHQSRLGILPSPAKSAFSAQDNEPEQNIPPVPRIPDTVRLSSDLSHEVLQSVIRYSTPPIPAVETSRALATGPVLESNTADGTKAGTRQHMDEVQLEPGLSTQHESLPPARMKTTAHPSASPTEKHVSDNDSTPVRHQNHETGNASPHTDCGQWPLLNNFKAGASVSNSGDGSAAQPQADPQPKSVPEGFVPQETEDINKEDYDEDDQPPRLSYEPIAPNSESREDEALPSYLIPTHLDVSDDEDYNQDNQKSFLGTPRNGKKFAGSLLPSVDAAPIPASVHGDGVTRNPDAMPNTQAVSLETDSNPSDALISECIQATPPSQAAEDDATPGADSRDQASSPAPVWFAKGDLQVPKTRVHEAEGSPEADNDQMHTSGVGSGKDTAKDLQPQAASAQGTLSTIAASADGTHEQPRRVSAAPLQVVHAVEEYAASDASFTSWDDSVVANSLSGSSQPGDMRDESDLVTPVAPVPRIIHHGQADQAEGPRHNSRDSASSNSYFAGHEIPSPTIVPPQQQSSDLAVPERSKSMLSMISSMVSENGAPGSPTSSNAGRSTPSTIRRMQRESPGKSPLMSVEIPEESMAMHEDRTPPAKNDDFDLYADHNGIVKDVRDESGQPLRIAQSQVSDARSQPQPIKPDQPTVAATPETHNEDRPRYSTERPMSFISGPTDQDGRPQDQLNQPLQDGVAAMQTIPGQGPGPNPSSMSNSSGPVYTKRLQRQATRHPGLAQAQQVPSQNRLPVQTPVPSNGQSEEDSSPSVEVARPHQATSSTPQQQISVPSEPSQPSTNGQISQPDRAADHSHQDPRMYGTNTGQSMPQQAMMQGQMMPQQAIMQGQMAPQRTIMQGQIMPGQMMIPAHDPRFPRQLSGPNAGPRNEYEMQQHMMQLHAQHPRPQGANGVGPQAVPQVPSKQTTKRQDKLASIPKLSSVFKGIGGKLQGNTQQAPQPPNTALRPDMLPYSSGPAHNASPHSVVSSLHHEQPPTRPTGEQPVYSAPPNRPPSNGAESHYSHISQVSTRVQPTDSRVDLRKPASPMPMQGIPPQVMPQGAPMQSGQYRASTSALPETGKKKRFSTLGNIFGRSSDSQPAKTKMSKEQKRAQKDQRHFTAPASQWPPQQPHPHFQQNGQYPPGQRPPQQAHPTGPQMFLPQTMSPTSLQGGQNTDPYGLPQHYQQTQPKPLPQQQIRDVTPEQSSAYFRTRQLAEQHQAQKAFASTGQGAGPVPHPSVYTSSTTLDQSTLQSRQTSYGPPPGGYYNPNPIPSIPEQGAYKTTQAARLLAEQQRRQAQPDQNTYPVSHLEQQQRQAQPPVHDETAYRVSQMERLRLEQQRLQFEAEQRAHTVSGAERAQQQQENLRPQGAAHGVPVGVQQQPQQQHHNMPISPAEHQQPAQAHQQYATTQGASHDELLRAHQERQQLEQQLRSQQYAERVQPSGSQRDESGLVSIPDTHAQESNLQQRVSPPVEPQYETPQIPAAYSHVSGAFISPRDREQQSYQTIPQPPASSTKQYDQQYFDPRMQPISPQVSAQSHVPPNNRTHSDVSAGSVVSPISTPAQDMPSVPSPPTQRAQKPRMSSISEIHPGTPERPWHLNFPEGASEQEIVRARQRQFMHQQFTAQQQQHAERAAQSPSPRASSHSQSPKPPSAAPQQQGGGGFKELLPRSSPQPYLQPHVVQPHNTDEQVRHVESTQTAQPSSNPLPMSPESINARSPVNPLATALPAPPLPPPELPHSPGRPEGLNQEFTPPPMQQHMADAREQYRSSPAPDSHYEQQPPDEPPPSYDGPGVPNDGMDKSRPDQLRPPNITTDVDPDVRGRQGEPRSRQPSIGILQHPQPASMAASPQRSEADMGAESLRRQLLQQEEHARMERIQRAQIQRAESEREKKERDAARARARELELSVSGGGRVGSIRSIAGSRNGGQPGWERRGSTSRQVFELPAVEDDEPSMKATSYPGQEWVPPVWTDE